MCHTQHDIKNNMNLYDIWLGWSMAMLYFWGIYVGIYATASGKIIWTSNQMLQDIVPTNIVTVAITMKPIWPTRITNYGNNIWKWWEYVKIQGSWIPYTQWLLVHLRIHSLHQCGAIPCWKLHETGLFWSSKSGFMIAGNHPKMNSPCWWKWWRFVLCLTLGIRCDEETSAVSRL